MKEDTSTARLIAAESKRPGITERIPADLNIPGPRWAIDKKATELLLHLGVVMELIIRCHTGRWVSKTRLASIQDARPHMIRVNDKGSRYVMHPDPGDTVEIVDNKRNRTWLQEHLPHLKPKPEETPSSPSGGS